MVLPKQSLTQTQQSQNVATARLLFYQTNTNNLWLQRIFNCKQCKYVSTSQPFFSFSKQRMFLHARLRLRICSSSTHRCWACWCFWTEKAAPQVALCWTCCLKRSRILSHRSSATSRTVPVRLASKACQSQNIATQLMQKQINMKKEMSTHSPSKKERGEKSSASFIERCMHAKNRQLLCLLIPWS